jgi:hypothetical protein
MNTAAVLNALNKNGIRGADEGPSEQTKLMLEKRKKIMMYTDNIFRTVLKPVINEILNIQSGNLTRQSVDNFNQMLLERQYITSIDGNSITFNPMITRPQELDIYESYYKYGNSPEYNMDLVTILLNMTTYNNFNVGKSSIVPDYGIEDNYHTILYTLASQNPQRIPQEDVMYIRNIADQFNKKFGNYGRLGVGTRETYRSIKQNLFGPRRTIGGKKQRRKTQNKKKSTKRTRRRRKRRNKKN